MELTCKCGHKHEDHSLLIYYCKIKECPCEIVSNPSIEILHKEIKTWQESSDHWEQEYFCKEPGFSPREKNALLRIIDWFDLEKFRKEIPHRRLIIRYRYIDVMALIKIKKKLEFSNE